MSFVIIHHPNVHSTSFLCSFNSIVSGAISENCLHRIWEPQWAQLVIIKAWVCKTKDSVWTLKTCQLELSVVVCQISDVRSLSAVFCGESLLYIFISATISDNFNWQIPIEHSSLLVIPLVSMLSPSMSCPWGMMWLQLASVAHQTHISHTSMMFYHVLCFDSWHFTREMLLTQHK